MGKASKWIKNFLTGKKSSSHQPVSVDAQQYPKTPISDSLASSKDKRRWSFRKASNTETYQRELNVVDTTLNMKATPEAENEEKRHALTVAVATAAAADAAAQVANEAVMRLTYSAPRMTTSINDTGAAADAAAKAVNEAVMRLTYSAPRMTTSINDTGSAADAATQKADEAVTRLPYTAPRVTTSVEDTAATKIQSVFRSYLARKALFALKGLVKLQALVRGHLVRKQAAATFRCLQALLTVQARARARRIKMIDQPNPYNPEDEHIKIVEMDIGVTRGSAKSMINYFNNKRTGNRHATYHHQYSKQSHQHMSSSPSAIPKQYHQHISPAPSAITNMSPKSFSGHFNDFFRNTSHRSPQYYPSMDKPPSKAHFLYKPENDRIFECQFSPNYMASTKSSKAKFRSQSAPKQRPADTFQRQPSKRRVSMEGRNLSRDVRMERSSSVTCSTPQKYHPWSELDESAISIKDSECGSNSTFLTNSNYYRF